MLLEKGDEANHTKQKQKNRLKNTKNLKTQTEIAFDVETC